MGETLAIRPRDDHDGIFAVCFGAQKVATINLRERPDLP
jgi:hypothetical protein